MENKDQMRVMLYKYKKIKYRTNSSVLFGVFDKKISINQ